MFNFGQDNNTKRQKYFFKIKKYFNLIKKMEWKQMDFLINNFSLI